MTPDVLNHVASHARQVSAPFNVTPTYALSAVSPTSAGSSKRKRNSSNVETSPGSLIEDVDDDQDHKRRQPGVKRACDECRQQKLRCDVVQDPYRPCSRCLKHRFTCSTTPDFKRVGKRIKHATLEREKDDLEQENSELKQRVADLSAALKIPTIVTPSGNGQHAQTSAMYAGLSTGPDQFMGSDEAVASLLDLKSGYEGPGGRGFSPNSRPVRRLEKVMLAPDRVYALFDEYWRNYHGFLPLLDSAQSPEHYYEASELLFWTVITIAARHFEPDKELLSQLIEPYTRLVWKTMSNVPQNYHVVKAMCLLCTWPLPCSSTSSDPTFMFCGLMMKVAMQIGLHRPAHPQDFSKTKVQLREEDIKDRLRTWTACNIVAQTVSTGYGQPTETLYDATLSPHSPKGKDSYPLPEDLYARLELEKFCDRITKALYSNNGEERETPGAIPGWCMAKMLTEELRERENRLSIMGTLDKLHLRAIRLHLRLYAFFDSSASPRYREDLLGLYHATTSFLDCALAHHPSASNTLPRQPHLKHAPNYIMQMLLAASFTLHKLLNSFFATNLDREQGRGLFAQTVYAIRAMSVTGNDLPQRLTEVLVQLWQAGGAGCRVPSNPNTTAAAADPILNGPAADADNSLELKVRSRMSMSLVFDSVWRWREELQGKVRKEVLEVAVQNPTNPEATTTTTTNPTAASSTSASASGTAPSSVSGRTPLMGEANVPLQDPGMVGSMVSMGGANSAAAAAAAGLGPGGLGQLTLPTATAYADSYEFFDPMSSFLDGAFFSANDVSYLHAPMMGLEASGFSL